MNDHSNLLLIKFIIKRRLYWLSQCIIKNEAFVKLKHRFRLRETLDLKDPKTFNEKIQWIKLYCKNEIYTVCADKYAARGYVKEKIGESALNKLYRKYDRIEDININELPNSFVLKVTHGSGQNILCPDKSKVDWRFAFKMLKYYMRENQYYHNKEWAYKNIIPKIICEEYLEEDGKLPLDYKVFCFNGSPQYIQVDVDRFGKHERYLYNREWYRVYSEKENMARDNTDIKRPLQFQKMMAYASSLSKDFPFVRVDFYCLKNNVIFGEMTFYPGSGSSCFIPKRYDLHFGRLLTLPEYR